MCWTRSAARYNAYSHLYTAYVVIVKEHEVIALGLHKDIHSNDVTSGWGGKYRAEADRLLIRLGQFEFIITLLTVYQYRSHLEGITIKMQSTYLDNVHTFRLVEKVGNVYQSLRKTVTNDFTRFHNQAVRMAGKMDVQPAKP